MTTEIDVGKPLNDLEQPLIDIEQPSIDIETPLIDIDRGTDESLWRGWPALAGFPLLDLTAWSGRRVVVLAAHPDDEVLAVGGLLALLARARVPLTFIWASSGEASHPGSTALAPAELIRLRRREAGAALALLGVRGEAVWLGLPDGGLEDNVDALVRSLRRLHRPGDLWFAPFRGDGHPDHEACGRAAAEVADGLIELPIWTWHWATPGDERVPWDRARTVPLPDDVRACKAAAIAAFRTQVAPIGPDAADGPVLPARVLEHFERGVEVVLA